MDGTTAVVIFLAVIGTLCAIIAILYATSKHWVAFTIFFVLAAMCLIGAWYKPKIDAEQDRAQQQAKQEILKRYPEIQKIVDLDRISKDITYVDQDDRTCSTTVVRRDDQWLVNTQTADCSKSD